MKVALRLACVMVALLLGRHALGQGAGAAEPGKAAEPPKARATPGAEGKSAGGEGLREKKSRVSRVENQGWFVVSVDEKLPNGQSRVVLFHVPPRTGVGGAADGTLRPAGELVQMPVAWCVRGRGLYMLFEEPPRPPAFPGPPKPRRLLTVRATRTETGEWATDPAGRPDVLPNLDGAGEMIDIVGCGPGIVAVRRVDGRVRLDVLRMDATSSAAGWEQVNGLPAELEECEDRLAIAGGEQGVLIAAAPTHVGAEGAGVLWSVNLTGQAPTWAQRPLGALGARALRHADGVLTLCAGQLLASWTDRAGAFHVVSRELDGRGEPTPSDAWRDLATQPGVYSAFTPVAMDQDERLAVMYNPPAPDKPKAGETTRPESRLMELSVRTGRVLYDGPIRLAPPISGADYVLMGVVMWMVLGMVIAGIVPPREGVVVIAEGSSIAEPMRRVIAGVIDFSLAMLAVSRIEGVALDDMLTLGWWSGEQGQLVVVQALGALVVVCTVFECLLGRTPGKLVSGCEVVSTQVRLGASKQGEARPSLWRALVRNLLKWGLPPLGLLGVMDPGGRGRHDQFARTAVIVRYVPEDEPLDDDFDG
ncbi:MAG: hypothetical protein GC200_09345 [Tepidisphaera sp.]|nr:hypothetical protein [Tepidisphaera sp.]